MATQVQELAQAPEVGQLVRVRDRQWVVADVDRSTQAPDVMTDPSEEVQSLVRLVSIEEEAIGEDLSVIWEIEPGCRILEDVALPKVEPGRLDDPAELDAFLDAVRWGTIASADRQALQAPFRSGITIENYQLDPAVRALSMPRTSLLIADDVGLGKTIEAGLVSQELLLRQRARTILILCPASLCHQWQSEMRDKFGLDFRIVNSELLKWLRRERGVHANPWTHYPRLIASIDWVKGDRQMRLFSEILPRVATHPRTFDLLIVDEVHGCAPSGTGRYATDSQRTKALRRLVPHFEHRIFLSATPHNGYLESFTALLAMLDDQRFARGVKPDPEQLAEVMVRRLKRELPIEQVRRRFPERKVKVIPVTYSDPERQAYDDLVRYQKLRHDKAERPTERTATDFISMILKQRFLSSPRAFQITLDRHRRKLERPAGQRKIKPTERVLRRTIDSASQERETEDELEAKTDDAMSVAAAAAPPGAPEERNVLDRLTAYAEGAQARADSKALALIEFLKATSPPNEPDAERILVFTEYRDTLFYLQELLTAHGLGGNDRLRILHGGMRPDEQRHVRELFLADVKDSSLRILLATDVASEGVDLHSQCRRLVHYEIPWNPNRLEQRNGRIDRWGQPAREVFAYHFAGAQVGEHGIGTLDADAQFLDQVVRKVSRIRDDLGSVGRVIAEQTEEAMLGRRPVLETESAESRNETARALLRAERDLRQRIARLRERLDRSVEQLGVSPERVERVVRAGLRLAGQPDLQPARLDRDPLDPAPDGPVFRVPQLTGGWGEGITESLAKPVTQEIRPITFDHEVAANKDDVVLFHLGSALVQRCLRLLRSEIWATEGGRLARVTAREAEIEDPVLLAHGRLVVTGAEGYRLHEEVITAACALRDGSLTRLNVAETQAMERAATDRAAPAAARPIMEEFNRYGSSLFKALEARGRDRAESLTRQVEQRAAEDAQWVEETLNDLRQSIEGELEEPIQLALELESERDQLDRDRRALEERLAQIPSEIEGEKEAIRRRYADPKPRLMPVAVTILVPLEENGG